MMKPDLTTVQLCVPAHMLALMTQECLKNGLEMRADVHQKLSVASAAPLARLDMLSVSRIAKQVDDVATALLRDLSPDDPREGLYACATFCLLLVDEGRLADNTNMAVLLSLQLLDDVKDDKPDDLGQLAVWHLREERWRKDAKAMLWRANLQGLYLNATH